MNAQLAMFAPARDQWDWLNERDWLATYQEAESRALRCQAEVEAACQAFKANRTRELQDSYARADRAYDAAREAFQRDTYHIVQGIRAIAGIARALELRGSAVRMI